MRPLFEAMHRDAVTHGDVIAVRDDQGVLSRRDFLGRVESLAHVLKGHPRVIGLFAPNGRDWAIAQLAGALAGKIVVPLPTFFSEAQLGHIARDAAIETILATQATWPRVLRSGLPSLIIEAQSMELGAFDLIEGFGQVIYTSGSTGRPKGVRHESGQIAWSAQALAEAIGASARDVYLSVLPLPLLLETICALFVPQLVGALTHFDTAVAEAVGRGSASGLAQAFETQRPTTSVLVPQLLKAWVGELASTNRTAPTSLRFVAVGGAPVATQLAETARSYGIPVHEGYGLSECCSVVAVNRTDARRPGTAGRPLTGLSVTIEDGEIVVDGPALTDGYLNQGQAERPWRTGDLGAIDADGFLSVHGRKDSLIVTAYGRNISPEWVETMLLADLRIALCAVFGHGEAHLTAVLIPSQSAAPWFAEASRADVLGLIAECCAEAPAYAVPQDFILLSQADAVRDHLLTANGRFVRSRLPTLVAAKSPAASVL
ncbi:AMP-binding protein [Lichenifustis flavocetrariae]|uniref:AMP-binding protein n=1 Tax=Lichenifustis flavocetrariae TaxID=2949735 RepID=A0AA41Z4A4_9HYPH|nr:AMP-binding protein [Lichenifustis flavocetrariae]MCW6512817.1 AMP-binding protein [Lichenifustis flavocetrariae]